MYNGKLAFSSEKKQAEQAISTTNMINIISHIPTEKENTK